MGGLANRWLGRGQYDVLRLDRAHPRWALRISNTEGHARKYKLGSGTLADVVAGDTETALTGTVTLTKDSVAVTGAGTAFTTELAVGDVIALADGRVLAKVAAIAGDTSLTLAYAWIGATAAGATAYKVTMTEKTVPAYSEVTVFAPIEAQNNEVPLTHKFLHVEAVDGPVVYALSAPDVEIMSVVDSKAAGTI